MHPTAPVAAVQPTLDGRLAAVITCPHCHGTHNYAVPTGYRGPIGARTCPTTRQLVLIGQLPHTHQEHHTMPTTTTRRPLPPSRCESCVPRIARDQDGAATFSHEPTCPEHPANREED